MRLPDATAGGTDPRLRDAARQLESMLLRQVIETSGVFDGGEGAGRSVRAGMFAEALADAVAQAGGLGLADQVTRSLSGGAAAGVAAPLPAPGPARALAPAASPAGAGPALGALSGTPVQGTVTSRFGTRVDPFTAEPADHHGVDLGAPEGAPIRAPGAGVVVRAGPRGGYGNAVEIDHGNGVVTLYGHAAQVLVTPGEKVEAGQEIATVGSTGRSTGPHLHFEVRVGGRPVDPARVLKTYAARAEGFAGTGP
ncbi:MAG: peptidoglycan DD-metalloendopeptidase family protein [Anaeromyxobacter sp.]